jgi:hypothetical protein
MRLPSSWAERLQVASLHAKVMDPEKAAALIAVGVNVGMSDSTGAACPKAVTQGAGSGQLGHMDVAVVKVAGILPGGG